MSLVDKIRLARQSQFEAGGFTFTISRPTDLDIATLGDKSMQQVAAKFVCGWNLKELDVIPGGTGSPAPFDSELFAEWLADRPEFWMPLAEEILARYKQHVEGREENLVKPEAG